MVSEFFDFARNGSMYVGIVTALITWFMMTKFTTFDAVALAAVLAALFAGVVVSFILTGVQDPDKASVLGRYSFGLLLGTTIYFVFYKLSKGTWPTTINRTA